MLHCSHVHTQVNDTLISVLIMFCWRKRRSDFPIQERDFSEDDARKECVPAELFVEKWIGDDLKCPVCLEVPWHVWQLGPGSECGHLICSPCFLKVGNKCLTCGIDRDVYARYVPYLSRRVANAKVKCMFTANGCPVVMAAKDFPAHVKQCLYALKECIKCKAKITKGTFLKHKCGADSEPKKKKQKKSKQDEPASEVPPLVVLQ